MTTENLSCRLLHHGAAATSSSKAVICIPSQQQLQQSTSSNSSSSSTEIVYASHAMLNVARYTSIQYSNSNSNNNNNNDDSINNNTKKELVWNVYQTLRTSTKGSATANNTVATATAKRVITCVSKVLTIQQDHHQQQQSQQTILVCGFSDGTITTWLRQQPQQQRQQPHQEDELWKEQVIVSAESEHCDGRSITDIGAIYYNYNTINDKDEGDNNKTNEKLIIVTCSSGGAYYYIVNLPNYNSDTNTTPPTSTTTTTTTAVVEQRYGMIVHSAANSVRFQNISNNKNANDSTTATKNKSTCSGITCILVGTAAPRHNKIHVFALPTESYSNNNTHGDKEKLSSPLLPHYYGPLSGHEDWITCFDWFCSASSSAGTTNVVDMLASGSQDARIRLWKFTTTPLKSTTKISSGGAPNVVVADNQQLIDGVDDGDADDDNDDDSINNADLEEDMMDEGEARLEIIYENSNNESNDSPRNNLISVTLEALLMGHEERVTSVAWHPKPKDVYGQDLILFSSSMDRTILIWSEHESGFWTPVSRVGSAGGILGGPIGSTLLGYLNILLEPNYGDWLLGHGFGGALHLFSCEKGEHTEGGKSKENHTDTTENKPLESNNLLSIEERAALIPWRAQPCVTGHFDGVTDLCWEADRGDYLITVSNDHTCRIWLPFQKEENAAEQVWIEIARPQVHGYNLSAVTSLSTPNRRHTIVSGADEKEIRVFDATQAFTRLLHKVFASSVSDKKERVERAYIPSLGLSNKATAADGAEEDTGGVSKSNTSLPLERDLGSVSIWPEVLKLYGHASELVRLTCTLAARTGAESFETSKFVKDILVASTAKARDAEAAKIRIWDVEENKCVQILAGGHRSTVTAISFSPDGKYLASSGKDRRLCLWQRSSSDISASSSINPDEKDSRKFELADALDSSHKRIVWSVHFCPFDPTLLASGSRDGCVKIWKLVESKDGNEGAKLNEMFQFSPYFKEVGSKAEAVTALAFAPNVVLNMGILALGLECGLVEIWTIPLSTTLSEKPELKVAFPAHLCHIGAVSKLAWRPERSGSAAGASKLILASSAADHGCRIYEVNII